MTDRPSSEAWPDFRDKDRHLVDRLTSLSDLEQVAARREGPRRAADSRAQSPALREGPVWAQR